MRIGDELSAQIDELLRPKTLWENLGIIGNVMATTTQRIIKYGYSSNPIAAYFIGEYIAPHVVPHLSTIPWVKHFMDTYPTAASITGNVLILSLSNMFFSVDVDKINPQDFARFQETPLVPIVQNMNLDQYLKMVDHSYIGNSNTVRELMSSLGTDNVYAAMSMKYNIPYDSMTSLMQMSAHDSRSAIIGWFDLLTSNGLVSLDDSSKVAAALSGSVFNDDTRRYVIDLLSNKDVTQRGASFWDMNNLVIEGFKSVFQGHQAMMINN
jgi:hypothetical protein